MSIEKFDIVIIGGGPGGYVAAIRAAQLGLKTAVIEKEHLGGICLNWGCIPSKALLRSAEINNLMSRLGEFGFSADNVNFDAGSVVDRSRLVANKLSKGVKYLLQKNKVTIFMGVGRISAPGIVEVANEKENFSISAKDIVISTGAHPKLLSSAPENDPNIWTYKKAMVPEAIPASLVVIGSGAIGVEFASFYRDMGSSVTLIESLSSILPAEDNEISAFVAEKFAKGGITIHTSSTVKSIGSTGGVLSILIEKNDGTEICIEAEKSIVAIGIAANIDGLGLENTKIQTIEGHIKVNHWMETSESHIYAIGDVVGPPWLAHKASHEAVVCVEKIAGLPDIRQLDYNQIPGCTYSRPQVASIGLTEQKATEANKELKIGRFPFRGNGKAVALGEPEGLIKTIFDAVTGELLGAHMVGPEVTELVHGFVIAMGLECTEEDLMHTIFPHPTLSEIMHESVLDAYDKALHI
ncbi:MAG: dihydrolipoyl dehydrogenase [Rhodospirillaceae bacterium]|nr:dihydrolipoyl dehydrogenase [Rhodospirillaceae bacterium]